MFTLTVGVHVVRGSVHARERKKRKCQSLFCCTGLQYMFLFTYSHFAYFRLWGMILPQSDKNLEIQEQVKHMKQEEANGREPATFVEGEENL